MKAVVILTGVALTLALAPYAVMLCAAAPLAVPALCVGGLWVVSKVI